VGLPDNRASYDVAADGRFVFVEKPPETPAPRQIVLIADFARELKQKLRAGGRVADGDRVWLLVGDVSGKGVGAALFMAVTKTLFRAIAPGSGSVAEAMGRINQELARDNERAMFVTDDVTVLALRWRGPST
jgi:hypothetical protein